MESTEEKKKSKLKKILLVVVLTVFIGALLFKIGGSINNPFYALLIVRSDSMRPVFAAGDMIYVNKNFTEINPGDIVCFVDNIGEVVTHRVKTITDGVLITQGDSNSVEDSWSDDWALKKTDVIGKYVFAIPKVGYFFAQFGGLKTGANLSDRQKASVAIGAIVFTPTPTVEPTLEPVETPEPAMAMIEPMETLTPTPSPTEEPTPTPEPTDTPEPTEAPMLEPTEEPTPILEVTVTPELTATSTVEPTLEPVETSEVTPSPTPEVMETLEPTPTVSLLKISVETPMVETTPSPEPTDTPEPSLIPTLEPTLEPTETPEPAATSIVLLDSLGSKLDTSKVLELNVGQTMQITASLVPDGAIDTLRWKSNDESVVAVTNDGKITAVSPGTATIKIVTSGGITISLSITVTN